MEAAFDDREILDGFFADVEESFAPQVAEAQARLRAGDVSAGVDMMMRPLHTIKGTTAFLGLTEISGYTHKVEELLKSIQNGAPAGDPERLTHAVDMVFSLLELAREGRGAEGSGHLGLLEEMENWGAPRESGVSVEQAGAATVLRVIYPRVHLPSQWTDIERALGGMQAGAEVGVDLTRVRTLNSTAWGLLLEAGRRCRLSVFGLMPANRSIFYAWGFNAVIRDFEDEAAWSAAVAGGEGA